ncbi:putative mitochondrial protein [Tanacetum coccineum]
MSKDVKTFVRKCDICQRNKPNLEAYPRALQPLPIPDKVWQDVSMDFIDGLPSSHGKTLILVVVDRLTKIGKVAYKLQLPNHVKVHPVFHISQLMKCRSEVTEMSTFPLCDEIGLIVVEPQAVLDRRMQKKGDKAVVYV